MATIQRRLHISGLTPAITVTDINARLQGFGKVLALDGFGLLNGLGEPRKFGYVTLEATESNLSRCLNLLSGTTWKGTKLRIGEAKPDYAQRLQNERKQAIEDAERPSKRRRLPRGVHGIISNDMSVVNLENVETHPGWHRTALSHLIRPMKMRPARPLSNPSAVNKVETLITKRRKPSAFGVPVRARVRTIDPRLFASTHLRENMLDAVVINPALSGRHVSPPQTLKSRSPSVASSVSERESVEENNGRIPPDAQVSIDQNMDIDLEPNIAREKLRQLDLLSQMFGDTNSEWGQKESVDGEATEDHHSMSPVPYAIDAEMTDVASSQQHQELVAQAFESAPVEKITSRSLKDIFKPQEEQGGFSVIRNLVNLDLDLDPAFDFSVIDTTAEPVREVIPVTQTSLQQPNITLDNSLPFYFPQPDIPRVKDLFSIARAEGWSFGRSGDSETIRNRWDETKGALTQEWKKRSREAAKSRRRHYGVAGGEDI
ncbi:hypothetical protein BU17DRAFT_58287 [Hysterangium stoloniferum]|nr:hypothetical protein BU17DRAFT_58287 [Hysterangium stoloniferum]